MLIVSTILVINIVVAIMIVKTSILNFLDRVSIALIAITPVMAEITSEVRYRGLKLLHISGQVRMLTIGALRKLAVREEVGLNPRVSITARVTPLLEIPGSTDSPCTIP